MRTSGTLEISTNLTNTSHDFSLIFAQNSAFLEGHTTQCLKKCKYIRKYRLYGKTILGLKLSKNTVGTHSRALWGCRNNFGKIWSLFNTVSKRKTAFFQLFSKYYWLEIAKNETFRLEISKNRFSIKKCTFHLPESTA